MLEVVGVNLAILGGGVRLHVVGEFLDDQLVAVLLDERFDRLVQDLRVRGRGGGHGDGLVVLLGGGTVGTGIAAACQAEGRERGDGARLSELFIKGAKTAGICEKQTCES